MVLVTGGIYEPVYSFCKRAPTVRTDFIQVFFSDASPTSTGESQYKEPLELTGNHMVFQQTENGRRVALRASKLQVGDRILLGTNNSHYVSVSELRSVRSIGAYAPYTASGTIVVNGVLASTYSTIDDDDGGLLSNDSQAMLHFAQTHHRVLCRYFSDWCRRENYSAESDGFSPISETSLNIYVYASSPSTPAGIKWALVAIIVTGLLLLRGMEVLTSVVSHNYISSMQLVILVLFLTVVSHWRIRMYRHYQRQHNGHCQK
jgi:hypothetical protein